MPDIASPAPIVEIAADGGERVGFGHVGRCLAVAEYLEANAVFRVEDPAVAEFVSNRGGVCVTNSDAPVVLLDRAGPTDADGVRELQACGRRVALLDDRGNGRMVADLIIDPPTAASWPPAAPRRLAGFEHVLLRREVRESRQAAKPRGVLLALGGSDPTHLTPALAEALRSQDLRVNLGPGYAGPRPEHGELLTGPHEFVGGLASATLLVAAYGHSLLEAAFLGVPALIVVTRPDHREHAEAFVSNGTAQIVATENVAEEVSRLLADQPLLEAMSARGRALVDGRGSQRVAAAILDLAS
jgi:spore coat polysaccharide biosynthesis predicted glycosyltransferase SpsG